MQTSDIYVEAIATALVDAVTQIDVFCETSTGADGQASGCALGEATVSGSAVATVCPFGYEIFSSTHTGQGRMMKSVCPHRRIVLVVKRCDLNLRWEHGPCAWSHLCKTFCSLQRPCLSIKYSTDIFKLLASSTGLVRIGRVALRLC